MLSTNAPKLPRCMPGFNHINRFFDKRCGCPMVTIKPGEYYITQHDEIISTVLGSCISVCIFDEHVKIGGMNHFMLPSQGDRGSSWEMTTVNSTTRFGNFAMEQLINKLLARGCQHDNLKFKVFGGGNIIPGDSINVGDNNIHFIKTFMADEGYKVIAHDVGDIFPRKVQFFPLTGKVNVKKLPTVNRDEISKAEKSYDDKLVNDTPKSGSVELF
ncbi:MAG: chemoreceptor glutamine deamidase CheD [Pseudomonadales bacterium]|nr:chemoreceptor glutamine deamidase CheD [Pseudomonadales bacterium]